jgi:CRISPR/Cas system CMR-associated protein Cmr5 small subunit
MPVHTLHQHRAAAAFQAIGQATVSRDLATKLPTMMQTNGLLATVAFLLKRNPPLAAVVIARLRDRYGDMVGAGDALTIFERWCGPNGPNGAQLRALTAEALEYAVWLKRVADAREGA